MVVIMLASSSANVVLLLEFYLIQLPTLGVEVLPSDVLRRLVAYNLGTSWLSRLNVSISA